MSHTKAGGSTKLGRDSAAQRLGVKVFGGQEIKAGGIIVRQRGTKMVAGDGVKTGRDHTLFAAKSGNVVFSTERAAQFTGSRQHKTIVSVQ